MCGRIGLRRSYYVCNAYGKSFAPLDLQLGVDGDPDRPGDSGFLPGVQELVALAGSRQPGIKNSAGRLLAQPDYRRSSSRPSGPECRSSALARTRAVTSAALPRRPRRHDLQALPRHHGGVAVTRPGTPSTPNRAILRRVSGMPFPPRRCLQTPLPPPGGGARVDPDPPPKRFAGAGGRRTPEQAAGRRFAGAGGRRCRGWRPASGLPAPEAGARRSRRPAKRFASCGLTRAVLGLISGTLS